MSAGKRKIDEVDLQSEEEEFEDVPGTQREVQEDEDDGGLHAAMFADFEGQEDEDDNGLQEAMFAEFEAQEAPAEAAESSKTAAKRPVEIDLTGENVDEPTAEQVGTVVQSSPSAMTKSAYDPIRHAPLSDTPLPDDDPEHGKFASRLVFESDPCDDEWKYFLLSRLTDAAYQSKVSKGEKKIRLTGESSKRRYTMTGSAMKKDAVPRRLSAAEKFWLWRSQGPISKDRIERRKVRHITLLMGPPHGPEGEGGHWAGKVKSLRNIFTTFMPKSVIKFLTSIPPSPFAASGQFREYIKEIQTLCKDFPDFVTVEMEDDSILTVNSSDYYHRATAEDMLDLMTQQEILGAMETSDEALWNQADEQGLSLAEVEAKYTQLIADTRARYKALKQGVIDSKRAQVDAELAFCQAFVQENKGSSAEDSIFIPED
ncbi:hypothetical protein BDV95DRAFT_602214 [Massariosphaeria phaeospora]|uniref:Uncharacterized protein n=1 Tax=Massariosphaeria phaeospora TaxID=100035 RepID=A0A7C8IF16_9PLEO|nr:hypothetical protein BDV95DRAFT_602214 [Massariosphaeria phaeospora]